MITGKVPVTNDEWNKLIHRFDNAYEDLRELLTQLRGKIDESRQGR